MNRVLQHHGLKVLLAGCIILVGVLLYFGTMKISPGLRVPQRAFERDDWLQGPIAGTSAKALRQTMIRDLIVNFLPGKSRAEIIELLGSSPTQEEMRKYRLNDVVNRDPNLKPGMAIPRRGDGYEYDEFGWDLIYWLEPMPYEFLESFDSFGSPDKEVLLIRLDSQGRFESWYVYQSPLWPQIVGTDASKSYRVVR